MAWKVCDCMTQRREFVALARQGQLNMSQLCRQFNISRKTGYKWLGRYRDQGDQGLVDRSRRPRRTRSPTPRAVEQQLLNLRDNHKAWGPKKLAVVLARQQPQLARELPCTSTIAAILKRHGRIREQDSISHQPMRRFERSSPNELWQMDFKGEFKTTDQRWCYPLTILDDHSRYNLCLAACVNQTRQTVQERLTAVFERFGLPWEILTDNGNPWGSSNAKVRHTKLSVWLMRLGIATTHGRPFHPQTQGKEERFHRTLKAELLQDRWWSDRQQVQRDFDPWREQYNHVRPHEALGMGVPSDRYRASVRSMPRVLPEIVYDVGDHVRRVSGVGQIRFENRVIKLSQAFAGEAVALRATAEDGVWQVYYSRFEIAKVDLSESNGGQ